MHAYIKSLWLVLCLVAGHAWAIPPYWAGQSLTKADTSEQLSRVERKLQAAGFTILGRHTPKGLPDQGTVVFTDKRLLDAVRSAGEHAILAAGLRVGVNSAGNLNFTNPEYWMRAYLRGKYPEAEKTAQQLQARLEQAFGPVQPMGGDVPAAKLANYQYMAGLERLESLRSELKTGNSFEEALKTVQTHLAQGMEGTAKVYEVVMPEQKMAVFGVAMNKPGDSEAWWINKLGAPGLEHTAALPYEIYIVNGKLYSLYGRYRIALAWPALDLGQFMSIRYAPDVILNTMKKVAGAAEANTFVN